MKPLSDRNKQHRYIANTPEDRKKMLDDIGVGGVEDILSHQMPDAARLKRPMALPAALSEPELLQLGSELAGQNFDADEYTSFLGAGIYDHFIPSVVGEILSREEFYTAYTPYQPEMSQGTLQSIYEYQTLICRLTGMDVSNASMYDGASSLGEAAVMGYGINGRRKIAVSKTVHPLYRQVLRTYLTGLQVEIIEVPYANGVTDVDAAKALVDGDTIGLVIQNPNFFGVVEPVFDLEGIAHRHGGIYIVDVDPISLGMLKPPGDYNADIVTGEGQDLGINLNYGGPLLGIFACKQEYIKRLPGRLVGATIDKKGNKCYTLTLQTREQHIRREHATSNICTNQALMALAATVYLSLLGKDGIKKVADLCYQKSHYTANVLSDLPGLGLKWDCPFLKEFVVRIPDMDLEELNSKLLERKIIGGLPLGRYYNELSDCMLIAVTEKRTKQQIDALAGAVSEVVRAVRGGVGHI